MTEPQSVALAGASQRSRRPFQDVLRRLLRNRRAWVGGVITLTFVLVAAFAPLLVPYDPFRQNTLNRLQAPSSEHVLGTDELGRDVLSRIIYGSRVSLLVAVMAVVVSLVVGVALGAIAGYYGGVLDNVIMRVVDLFLALPAIVLAIALVAVLGSSLWNVVIALGATGWVQYARIVRGQMLSLKEQEHVVAAKALGSSASRIILQHMLPNTASAIIVVATLSLATMIVSEASLSFLGLGVPPPEPTWGGMLNTGRRFLRVAFHISVFPGLAIMITVLGINLLGDALRDVLDPTLRHR